jgi:hypothetical protein
MRAPLVQQSTRSDAEGFSKFLNYGCGWITRTPFDIANISPMYAGTVGIILLAPAFLMPKPFYVQP